MNNTELVNSLSGQIAEFFSTLSQEIENNIENGVKIGSTKLGQQMAEKLSLNEPLSVALTSMYVKMHSDLETRQGQGGGIYRPSITPAKVVVEKVARVVKERKVKDLPKIPGINA